MRTSWVKHKDSCVNVIAYHSDYLTYTSKSLHVLDSMEGSDSSLLCDTLTTMGFGLFILVGNFIPLSESLKERRKDQEVILFFSLLVHPSLIINLFPPMLKCFKTRTKS